MNFEVQILVMDKFTDKCTDRKKISSFPDV
jgi:hypothetical protein